MTNPIAVFGSINMDLVVYSSAKPKDGETIFGKNFETFLGGKGANQAVASSRTGSNVSFVGKSAMIYMANYLEKDLTQKILIQNYWNVMMGNLA